MTIWIKDNNGNKCSVKYFGSVEKAQAALDSLENCKNCTNCSFCYRCSDCSVMEGEDNEDNKTAMADIKRMAKLEGDLK